jgi:anti-sigma28 factor (negative regulator of flagellin synthesis)
MENTKRQKLDNVSQLDAKSEKRSPRKRSMTTLKLQWVAERVRRCRRIKEQVQAGTYLVDSKEVAKALLNVRDEDMNLSEEDIANMHDEDFELC